MVAAGAFGTVGGMRARYPIALAAVATLAAGAVAVQAVVARSRDLSRREAVVQLQSTWRQAESSGVPEASLRPLENQLSAATTPAWWSPDWWSDSPEQVIARLRVQTQQVYAQAVADARARARAVISDAQALLASAGDKAPAGFAAALATWATPIDAATTPADLVRLAHDDSAALDAARAAVGAAQARADAAETVRKAGGAGALLAAVPALDATAAVANLDVAAVDTLAAQLRAQQSAGQDTAGVAAQLASAITAFRAAVTTNDAVDAAMKPLQWDVEQSVVEGTPGSAGFVASFARLEQDFIAARTGDQLTGVSQAQQALRSAVDGELAGAVCGHSVPAGRVLVVSLSAQEMVAYQDGCVVRGTPVTTGRPALPTPEGTFHVFYKTSPFTMVSPWPPGSPFWYPTTPVTWVMEFAGGGYFIHDAGWEALDQYGPGGENNPYAASHGCIHVPTDTMQWLYSWTPLGAEVIVEG